jgi:hypothetical protein
LNGKKVWNGGKANECRCYTLNSNANYGWKADRNTITLKKGLNTLLVKVGGESREKAWGFVAAIPKSDGLLAALSTMGASSGKTIATATPPFRIDNSGRLFVANNDWLDYEEQRVFSLEVKVTDTGGLSTIGKVKVEVNDDNEPPSYMATVRLSVPENSDAGTLIGVPITPSDFDRDQTYTYSMTGGGSSFEIVPETGQIQVKNTAVLNYEGPQNTFTVVAESSDSGTPPQKSTIVIEIKITDVNESPSLPNGIVIEAREDAEMGGSIGEPLSIYAVDPDEGSKISFSKNFLDVAIRAEGCDDAGKRGGCGTTTINIGG